MSENSLKTKSGQSSPPDAALRVDVRFYSYFKDLTGSDQLDLTLPAGSQIKDLIRLLHERFPQLVPMARSTLVAVGVEYQPAEYVLRDRDEVSLFPPVQGG